MKSSRVEKGERRDVVAGVLGVGARAADFPCYLDYVRRPNPREDVLIIEARLIPALWISVRAEPGAARDGDRRHFEVSGNVRQAHQPHNIAVHLIHFVRPECVGVIQAAEPGELVGGPVEVRADAAVEGAGVVRYRLP